MICCYLVLIVVDLVRDRHGWRSYHAFSNVSAPSSSTLTTNYLQILRSKDPGYFYELIRRNGISGSHLRLIRTSEEPTAPGLRHGRNFRPDGLHDLIVVRLSLGQCRWSHRGMPHLVLATTAGEDLERKCKTRSSAWSSSVVWHYGRIERKMRLRLKACLPFV